MAQGNKEDDSRFLILSRKLRTQKWKQGRNVKRPRKGVRSLNDS